MGVVSAYQSIYSNEERGVVLGWTVAYGQKIAAEYELLLGRYIAFLPSQKGEDCKHWSAAFLKKYLEEGRFGLTRLELVEVGVVPNECAGQSTDCYNHFAVGVMRSGGSQPEMVFDPIYFYPGGQYDVGEIPAYSGRIPAQSWRMSAWASVTVTAKISSANLSSTLPGVCYWSPSDFLGKATNPIPW